MSRPDVGHRPLPFHLPPAFAEQLGYRRDRRFIAAYWEPLGDELTIRDDTWLACGVGDWYAWTRFFHRPDVLAWLRQHRVNLGNSDETATHWLIVDRTANQGFITLRDHGDRLIQQQRLANVE
jgi:hypothetical protein